MDFDVNEKGRCRQSFTRWQTIHIVIGGTSDRGQLLREKSISDPAIDSSAAKERNPNDSGGTSRHRRRRWQQDDFLLFQPPFGASHHLLWSGEHLLPLLSENRAQYVKHELVRRAELTRRCTELRLSGEFSGKPESLEKYRGTPGERAKIARRRTTLVLTGGMLVLPEYRERFVDFPRSRPRVVKHKDCLMPLEGSIEKESEAKAKYVAHTLARRAERQHKTTNLVLEGAMECKAEYRESFIDFPRQRPCVEKPECQLRPDGQIHCDPEYRSSFIDFPRERPSANKPEDILKLNGEAHFRAEYKESFIDFPRERPKSMKPEGDIKLDGDMKESFEYKAEYKESFIDFPRERPKCKRPTGDLKPEGDFQELQSEVRSRYVWLGAGERAAVAKKTESLVSKGSDNEIRYVPEYRERYVTFPRERPRRRRPGDQLKAPEVSVSVDAMDKTEARSKFTGEAGKRAEMVKKADSLKMEGELEVNPEYREQFVAPPKEALSAQRDQETSVELKIEEQPTDKNEGATLRPDDAYVDISGRSSPVSRQGKSPTRVNPSPIGRRRRSVSASEIKEPVSPYRAFRVIHNPYIGYEPTVKPKSETCRSPGSSPGSRYRPQKMSEAKRKASFVIINDGRKLDDCVQGRGTIGPCAAGNAPRGRWMPPWYAVPTVR